MCYYKTNALQLAEMHLGCFVFMCLGIILPCHSQDQSCGCTEVMTCPPNSNTTGEGASSVDDCVCYPGYMSFEGDCVEMLDCPPNSTEWYTLTVGGCKCKNGFVYLVSEGACIELFHCPENSSAVGGMALSILDCKCDHGYVRQTIDADCVWMYDCPLNSTKPWAFSVDECVCVSGYTSTDKGCVPIIPPAQIQPAQIAIYAVGGGVALIGSIAAVVQFLILPSAAVAPATTVVAGANLGLVGNGIASRADPAAILMDIRFIEYKV